MNEPLSEAMLFRIAVRIREQLVHRHAGKYTELGRQVGLILDQAEHMRPVLKLMGLCRSRGWMTAVASLTSRLEQSSRELLYLRGDLDRSLSATGDKVPSLKEVYLDLKQAQEEFGSLGYDHQHKALCITSEPIRLDGLYLGEFEISLTIPEIAEPRATPYRVIALDPHPPAANDSVTHPHVSDERLCAGDAYASINAALDNGRMFDFFSLVLSVLRNYNPQSPYVSLEDWDGITCWECGSSISPDDSRWCEMCEHEYCEDCASYCSRCDETTCLSCLSTCPVCEESVCSNCLTQCPNCERSLCKNCLDDGQCPCHEEEDDEPDADERSRDEGSTRSEDEAERRVPTQPAPRPVSA